MYIYNIHTNLKNRYIDFYEWNKNDKITILKKTPIIKVDKLTYNNLLYNTIRFNNLEYLKLFGKNKICLFSNGFDVFAIQINHNYTSIKRSSLLVNEELDILGIIKQLKNTQMSYNITKKRTNEFITRNESDNKLFITKYLKEVSKNDKKIIRYLYYELFNSTEKNLKKAKKKISKCLQDKNNVNYLFNILNIKKTNT